MNDLHQPLTYSVADACRVTSIKRTRMYELIGDGTIASVVIGRRRLVKAESLRKLVEAA